MLVSCYSTTEVGLLRSQISEFLTSGAIHTCLYLTTQSENFDVTKSPVFQHVFSRYYGINSAGVTPEFVEQLFRQIELSKKKGFKIEAIAKELEGIPNRKGQTSLQFSFITKVGATVNPKLPIYDSRVVDLLGYPNRKMIRDYDKRLQAYLTDYRALQSALASLISEDAIMETIKHLRCECPQADALPDERLCDLVLWAYHQLKPKLANKAFHRTSQ